MENCFWAGFSGHFVASGHFLWPRSALQRPDATWQRPRSGPWHVASGPWHVASGRAYPTIPKSPVAAASGYSGRYTRVLLSISIDMSYCWQRVLLDMAVALSLQLVSCFVMYCWQGSLWDMSAVWSNLSRSLPLSAQARTQSKEQPKAPGSSL